METHERKVQTNAASLWVMGRSTVFRIACQESAETSLIVGSANETSRGVSHGIYLDQNVPNYVDTLGDFCKR